MRIFFIVLTRLVIVFLVDRIFEMRPLTWVVVAGLFAVDIVGVIRWKKRQR